MIKTKVCQRMIKEVASYQSEVSLNESKLSRMKSDASKDEWDVKKFEEVLAESYMMVPDSRARARKSFEDLAAFVEQNKGEEGFAEDEWYEVARGILEEHLEGEKENVTKTEWKEEGNAIGGEEVF